MSSNPENCWGRVEKPTPGEELRRWLERWENVTSPEKIVKEAVDSLEVGWRREEVKEGEEILYQICRMVRIRGGGEKGIGEEKEIAAGIGLVVKIEPDCWKVYSALFLGADVVVDGATPKDKEDKDNITRAAVAAVNAFFGEDFPTEGLEAIVIGVPPNPRKTSERTSVVIALLCGRPSRLGEILERYI